MTAKEILSYLKKKENTRNIKCITLEESKQLLDYITTLQKENEKLESILKLREDVIIAQHNKIDKAVEYINKVKAINDKEDDNMYWEYEVFFPNMLKILQGDDNSENN